nr:zinc finger, CCHC-type [Tanacetum cinerariifolium]
MNNQIVNRCHSNQQSDVPSTFNFLLKIYLQPRGLQPEVAINPIIESMDAIFDEHRFSSVPGPSQRSLKDGTEDSGGSVVFERVSEETVDCYDIYSQSDYSSDGCEDNFLEWRTGRGGLYEPTSTLHRAWQ